MTCVLLFVYLFSSTYAPTSSKFVCLHLKITRIQKCELWKKSNSRTFSHRVHHFIVCSHLNSSYSELFVIMHPPPLPYMLDLDCEPTHPFIHTHSHTLALTTPRALRAAIHGLPKSRSLLQKHIRKCRMKILIKYRMKYRMKFLMKLLIKYGMKYGLKYRMKSWMQYMKSAET